MGRRIGEDWYEDWFALLPPDLSERAYRHHGEMAWDRSDALRVIALVERHGYEVSIIEIRLPQIAMCRPISTTLSSGSFRKSA